MYMWVLPGGEILYICVSPRWGQKVCIALVGPSPGGTLISRWENVCYGQCFLCITESGLVF